MRNSTVQISLLISLILHIGALSIYLLLSYQQKEGVHNAISVDILKKAYKQNPKRPIIKRHVIMPYSTTLKPVLRGPEIKNSSKTNLKSVPSTFASFEAESLSYPRSLDSKVKSPKIRPQIRISPVERDFSIHSKHLISNNAIQAKTEMHFTAPLEVDTEKLDIALEASSDKLAAFRAKIKKMINEAKKYPTLAKKKRFSGSVKIEFCLSLDGSVKEISITSPSKYEILNHAAFETIRRAQPYPEIPESLSENELWIEVTITFELKEKR